MSKITFKKIMHMQQTVFSFKELAMLFKPENRAAFKSQIHYHVVHGDLYPLRRGLYAKTSDYDTFELATKIMTPSYISFETVLVQAGIVFQYYSQIFVASYQSREIICDGRSYVFRALKRTILVNTNGIDIKPYYSIATPERAFLDIVYRNKRYHFDNLEPLNWEQVYAILADYGGGKSMRKRVDLYYASCKDQGGK